MKSVTISFSSGPSPEPPRLDEDIVLPLLDILAHQLNLRALTLQGQSWGNLRANMRWNGIPRKSRHLLQYLLRAPTVTCISFRGFQDIPPELLAQRSYEAVTFADGRISDSGSVTELNTASLTLDKARLMNFSLPNLRHINMIAYTFCDPYLPCLDIIRNCRNILESIQIRGKTSFCIKHLM